MDVVYRKVIDYARFIFAGYKSQRSLAGSLRLYEKTENSAFIFIFQYYKRSQRHRLRLLHLLFITYSPLSFSIH